jgi:hypothetical protein
MKKENIASKDSKEWTEEDRQNIVGFFDLLLKIDMRHNPEKYVRKNKRNNGT